MEIGTTETGEATLMPQKRTFHPRLSLERLERRDLLFAGISPLIEMQTNFGTIEMELLEDSAPQTVENFLSYVEAGDYTDAIFHRLVSNFVLQGGGFSASSEQICDSLSCSPDEVDSDIFQEVPANDPVVNEFDVSNLRGTVAMAKLGGDPDSATNQWFINLADNSRNLDNQNGGFTVFARVLDMAPVDNIVSFDTIDMSSEYSGSDRRRAIVNAPIVAEDGQTKIVRITGFGGSGVVHGTVFLDVNQNGARDNQDGGRNQVVVFNDTNNNGILDSPDESSTTTDTTGNYHLFIPNGDPYSIRILPGAGYEVTGSVEQTGTVAIGRSMTGVDFGTTFLGTTFHNSQKAQDVDGVNGVTPLDALLAINELTERAFSDPDTGDLITLSDPLDNPRFLDTNNDGRISPLDALEVINELNGTGPAAALSSGTDFTHFSNTDAEEELNEDARQNSLAATDIAILQLVELDSEV